jgi:tRNA dimethylallyltransferase
VALVGATAVGKTAAAVHLAASPGGEIVSADSRQIYRGMTIGTAKPTAAEQAAARHHLVDVRDPDEAFSLAEYLVLARSVIDGLHARGTLPLVVGGTAQYVFGLLDGWQVPPVAPQPVLRARLEAEGAGALHDRLTRLDPMAAAKIGPRNLRRLVRALEVWEVTGRTISDWQTRRDVPYRVLRLGLTLPRPELHRRIGERIDRMIEAGLLDEVRALLAAGYPATLPAFQTMGYAEIIRVLAGEWSLAEARAQIAISTHRFVRHQETWFRRDPTIRWVDASDAAAATRQLDGMVRDFLRVVARPR